MFSFFDTFKAEKEIELELFALLIESPGMSGASSQIFLTINDEQVKTNKEQSFGRQTRSEANLYAIDHSTTKKPLLVH